MAGKRDAAYYRARLHRDYPTFFADLISGKYCSVREAAAAAGLIHPPTRLDALKREWTRASEPQRIQFLKWVKAWDLARKSGTSTKTIARSNGQLTLSALAFLRDWLDINRAKPGSIMKEMGFSPHDLTVAYIRRMNAAPRKEVLEKLEIWFASKGYR